MPRTIVASIYLALSLCVSFGFSGGGDFVFQCAVSATTGHIIRAALGTITLITCG